MIYHNLYCAFFFKILVRRCYCFKKREASKTLHIKNKNYFEKKFNVYICYFRLIYYLCQIVHKL